MARPFNDLKRDLTKKPGGRAALKRARRALAAELGAHEVGLADLRRARSLTQVQLAAALELTQPQVSRIERETNLYLATLRSYVEAMGGRLELVGVFEDENVVLSIDEVTA
jgi:DNA-binding XRE family transcriptional regulator